MVRSQSVEHSAPEYVGQLRLDVANGDLDGRWTVRVPRWSADSIILLLNGGLTDVSVRGPQVARVSADDARGLSRYIVHLRGAATARDITLDVSTRGALRMDDEGINSVSPGYVELGLDSFWFPVIDGFPDFTGSVQLTLPAEMRVVSSGAISPTAGNRSSGNRVGARNTPTRTITITNTIPLPDFAFVAARNLASIASARGRAHAVSDDSAHVRAMLGIADRCADYLGSRYGQHRPLPPVDLILPPRTGPGYARQHYIVVPIGEWRSTDVAPELRAASQTGFLCHELAHFWSTGAVATGPDNWLNEGFAEFVSGRAVRALLGDSAYTDVQTRWRARAARAGAVWTPESTSRPNANAAYGKAPLLLATLEERIGGAAMERLLVRFMTEPVRTTRAVLDMMAEEVGRDAADWFERALGSAA